MRVWGRELSRVSLYARSFFFGKDGVCRSLVETNAPENARMRRKKYPSARFVRLPRGFAFAKRLLSARSLANFENCVLKPEKIR